MAKFRKSLKMVSLRTYSKEDPEINVSLPIEDINSNSSYQSDESVSNLGESLTGISCDSITANISNLGTSLQNSTAGASTSYDLSSPNKSFNTEVTNLGESLINDSYDSNTHDGYDILFSTPEKIPPVDYSFCDDSTYLSPIRHASSVNNSGKNNLTDMKTPMFVNDPENSDESVSCTEGSEPPSVVIEDNDSIYDPETLGKVTATNKRKKRCSIETTEKSEKLLWRNVSKASVARCKFTRCCEKDCIKKLPLKTIEILRFKYWTKQRSARRQWLLERIKASRHSKSKPLFVVEEAGVALCQRGFMSLYGVSKYTYYNIKQEAIKGAEHSSGNSKNREHSARFIIALNWLEEYATFHGDRMPNTDKILLPYKTRKSIIYGQYKQEHKAPIHITSFLQMWQEYFPHLRIKKVNSFSRCTFCTSTERQLQTKVDIRERERLRVLREEHNCIQMKERQYYYKKRNAAKNQPETFLSIIVDGMDQSKSNLPHFVGRMAKAVNPGDQLSTHITGVIAHGQNTFTTYLDLNQYPHDSNLTMNVILRTLKKISDSMGNKLPPILFLQADNCWRENKNKFILALCETLVFQRVFNEVHLSFLVVGHTHEDIDAAFSKIAGKLRRTDAETLPDLLSILPNQEVIEHVFNIRDWMMPHLDPHISDHTKPLHYRFVWNIKAKDVDCTFRGKHNAAWKPIANKFLKKRLPKKEPESVIPDYTNMRIEKVECHLSHWECLFTDQLTKKEIKWWKAFVAEIKSKQQSRAKDRKGQWLLPLLPRQGAVTVQEECVLSDAIQKLVDQQNEEPNVHVGSRRKRRK